MNRAVVTSDALAHRASDEIHHKTIVKKVNVADQIYAIEPMQKKLLARLREKKSPQSICELSTATGIPSWAADAAMNSAMEAGLVVCDVHRKWKLASRENQYEPA